jgi:NitT/TauT family transport system ATP-binding protein
MIQIHDLVFAYPHHAPVFEAFNWDVAQGDIWAVLGPSGCGKSTLLMLLAGLLFPVSGEVRVGGERLTRPRPRTGLILQAYGLLPWATVRENIALGLRLRRFYGPDGRHVPRDARVLDKAEIQARVDYWLARLDIAKEADKYPGQLSGGQRQRVAIARTLVLRPALLLMDEPFAALDAPTREGLQDLLLDLSAEVEVGRTERQEHARLTVVLVTHTIEEAAFVGQQILLLRPRMLSCWSSCLSESKGEEARRSTPLAQVIPNPHAMGGENQRRVYRRSDAYHAMCALLRNCLAP